MPQGGQSDGANVLPGDVGAAANQGVDLGAEDHRLDATGAGADAHVAADRLGGPVSFGTGRQADPDRVFLDRMGNRGEAGGATHRDDLLGGPQCGRGRRVARGRAVENRVQFVGAGVGHPQLEQEAVELCFGQRVRPLHFQRVLGGEDEEGRPEGIRFAADGDRRFLHRFQQGRLGLRRGAVDLVREHEIREDRSGLEHEPTASRLVFAQHVGADDVGGHQIRRELNARELDVKGFGQGTHQSRLAETGNTLEQYMAVGEQTDDHAVDHLLLADDHLADLAAQLAAAFGEVGQLLSQVGCGPGFGGVVHSLSSGESSSSDSR